MLTKFEMLYAKQKTLDDTDEFSFLKIMYCELVLASLRNEANT